MNKAASVFCAGAAFAILGLTFESLRDIIYLSVKTAKRGAFYVGKPIGDMEGSL